jgi:NADPH-dependent curcumin reductase CurA
VTQFRHREQIVVGIENFVPAFHRLFDGSNFGKLVLQVKAGESI